MTKNELLKLVAEKPHAIWAILQEAAYFQYSVSSETFEKHGDLLQSFAKEPTNLRDYRETTPENLFADYGHKRHTLYVFSRDKNPDGINAGTMMRMLGDADSYSIAADLWDAACATARVLGDGKIGLAVKVKED